jgi:hypothetical protein
MSLKIDTLLFFESGHEKIGCDVNPHDPSTKLIHVMTLSRSDTLLSF